MAIGNDLLSLFFLPVASVANFTSAESHIASLRGCWAVWWASDTDSFICSFCVSSQRKANCGILKNIVMEILQHAPELHLFFNRNHCITLAAELIGDASCVCFM